jgi:hypothetical protein
MPGYEVERHQREEQGLSTKTLRGSRVTLWSIRESQRRLFAMFLGGGCLLESLATAGAVPLIPSEDDRFSRCIR